MQSTVKAIQLGAYEYLVKPVDIDRLRAVVQAALDSRESRASSSSSSRRAARDAGEILGKSAAIRDVWKQIGAVSTTRAPVLISGESGTGKELVARAIHNASYADATGRSSPSTARRSRPACSRASCSATSRARSPARSPTAPAGSSSPARARCSSTRSPRSRSSCRRSCCACCRSARSSASATAQLDHARGARSSRRRHRDLAQMVAKGTFREDLYLPAARRRDPRCRRCASARATSAMLVEGLLAKIDRGPRQGRSATSRRPRSRS